MGIPKKPRTSATALYLPDELLEFHILPHLPVKTLMRFKSVSKKWHRIISSPHALLVHRQSQQAVSCLLMDGKTPAIYVSRDPTPVGIRSFGKHIKQILGNSVSHTVVASCNGLLCCTNGPDWPDKIVVGNPCLKNWKLLPANPFCNFRLQKTVIYGLAVDVGESSVRFQLLVLIDKLKNEYEVHIFSSTTKLWSVRKERIKLPVGTYLQRMAVYSRGYLYWKLQHHYAVSCFQMETKHYCLQPLPHYTDDLGLGNIGECGGKLSYAVIKGGNLEMWSFDQLHWSKRLSIALDNIVGGELVAVPHIRSHMSLRTTKPPHKKLVWVSMMPFQSGDCLSFCIDNVICCYDTQAGVFHKQAKVRSFSSLVPYQNTIVSLPREEEEEQKKRLRRRKQ